MISSSPDDITCTCYVCLHKMRKASLQSLTKNIFCKNASSDRFGRGKVYDPSWTLGCMEKDIVTVRQTSHVFFWLTEHIIISLSIVILMQHRDVPRRSPWGLFFEELLKSEQPKAKSSPKIDNATRYSYLQLWWLPPLSHTHIWYIRRRNG